MTGAGGYIGKRLLPALASAGFEVVCCVRDSGRFDVPKEFEDLIEVVEIDFLKEETLSNIPEDIDAAYYLIHSMSSAKNYDELERNSAENFKRALEKTRVRHVIYLSGIANEDALSKHLSSRKRVERILAEGSYRFTALRAGIIIGSGSASFEIIRDLTEKLPFMIAPKWLLTKCQPIAVTDVIQFLVKTLFNEKTYDKNFDIGGPDVLTYKEMLLGYAASRNLSRSILIVPVFSPRLSSYWLYFVTSVSYKLAVSLVGSMKVEVVCRNDDINKILEVEPITYSEALNRALAKIERDEVVSGWKDSAVSGRFQSKISERVKVPEHGCFVDERRENVDDESDALERIWSLGGDTGWYYADLLWGFRGFLDKLFGGPGLRRGRTNRHEIKSGDALDFWRVLHADRSEKRLLLFAEMKLPGEAWLEFRIRDSELIQRAVFRPRGLSGRLYWYSISPFHGLIFRGMIRKLARGEE